MNLFLLQCSEFNIIMYAEHGIIKQIGHPLKGYTGYAWFTMFKQERLEDVELVPLDDEFMFLLNPLYRHTNMTIQTEEAKLLAEIQKQMSGSNTKPDIEAAEDSIGGKDLPPGHRDAVLKITKAHLKTSQSGAPNINVQGEVVEDIQGSKTTNFAGVKVGFNYWFGVPSTGPRANIDPFGKGQMVMKKDGSGEYYCRSAIEEFYGDLKRSGLGDAVQQAINSGKMHDAYVALKNAIDAGLYVCINNAARPFNGEYQKTITKPVEAGYIAPNNPNKNTNSAPTNTSQQSETTIDSDLSNGERVESTNDAFGDGINYQGMIESITDGVAMVAWDDDSKSEIELKNLVSLAPPFEEPEADEEPTPFEEGRIITTNDTYEHGAGYEGTISSVEVSDDGSISLTISFEDGEETLDSSNVDLS